MFAQMESSNGRQREQNILRMRLFSNVSTAIVPGIVPGTSLPAWLTPLRRLLSFAVCIQSNSRVVRPVLLEIVTVKPHRRPIHQEHYTHAAAVYTSSTDISASAYRPSTTTAQPTPQHQASSDNDNCVPIYTTAVPHYCCYEYCCHLDRHTHRTCLRTCSMQAP